MAGDVQLGEVAEIIMGQSPPGETYNEHGAGLPFFQGVADFNYRHPTPRFERESDRRAIAHILGTLDDKIELNRQMNETLEAMGRALFKSWFIDFEPVRAKL